ncbi:MAG: lasso peptide biosynthesis B2 protein [Ilumatobacteraceae bacterium]
MVGSNLQNNDTALRRVRPWRHRFTVIEAMILLTLFGLAQRFIPMKWWAWTLGRPLAPPPPWLGAGITQLPVPAGSTEEFAVAVAVRRASSVLPWSPTCLAAAATGQTLLRQLGTAGVVVIGLRPPETSGDSQASSEMATTSPPWDAHAWLMGQHGALTGGPAARGFTATTVYEVTGRLTTADVIDGMSADAPSDP